MTTGWKIAERVAILIIATAVLLWLVQDVFMPKLREHFSQQAQKAKVEGEIYNLQTAINKLRTGESATNDSETLLRLGHDQRMIGTNETMFVYTNLPTRNPE